VGLTRNIKSAAKIKKFVSAAYEDKALMMTSVYYVIVKMKAGKPVPSQLQGRPRGLPTLSPL
jgi:hypothetical protein